MLDFYHRLAVRLWRRRGALGATLALSTGLFVWALLESRSGDDPFVLFTLLAALWCLLLMVLGAVFVEPAEVPQASDRLLQRLRKRVLLWLRWALALGFTALSLAAVLLTGRLALVASRALGG